MRHDASPTTPGRLEAIADAVSLMSRATTRAVCMSAVVFAEHTAAASPATDASATATTATVRHAPGKVAVQWVPNAGQWNSKAAFRAQSFAGSVWVTGDGQLVHQLAGPDANTSSRKRDQTDSERVEIDAR